MTPIPTRCSARTRTSDGVVVRAFRPAQSGSVRVRRGASRSTLSLLHPAGVFEGVTEGASLPLRLRARGRLPARRGVARPATRTRSCRRSASSTCTWSPRAATSCCTSSSAPTSREIDGIARHALRGVGADARVGQRGRRLQRLGRAHPPDALAGALAESGSSSCPASAPGRATSSRSARRTASCVLQRRPVRLRGRAAAADRVDRAPSRPRWRDAAWLAARAAQRTR